MKLALFRNTWVVLIGILLLASLVRLYRLNVNPPSPYWEEVALGYDAYSIAQTGKDFHGNPYPILAFPSYGDYKPSGYFYALVPFIKVLGLNVVTVRLPSVLAGIASVLLLYCIGKELFGRKVGLFSSLFFAVSPWAIQFSRGGWEVNFAMMLLLIGSALLIYARRKVFLLPPAVIFFGLSMYTYHAARLFAPLMGVVGLIALIVYWIRHIPHTNSHIRIVSLSIVLSGLLALAFVVPFVVNFGNQAVSSRFFQTTILSDLEPVLRSNAQIAAHGGTIFAKLIYHRYWYYGAEVFQGWVSHFSPSFLFIRGDGNLRHWNGRYGELYPLDFVFIVVTLAILTLSLKIKKLRANRIAILLVIVWILLAAVPAALVRPTPHALRFLFAAPGFTLLTAFGMVQLFGLMRGKATKPLLAAVAAAYIYLFGSYFYWYMNIYPARAAADWQYGYRQVFAELKKEKRVGERVYMTRDEGRPSMYYLFYSVYDPARIQTAGPSLPKDQLELLQVDDYYFVDSLPQTGGLFATPPQKVDKKASVLDTIRRSDGSVVWVVWRR